MPDLFSILPRSLGAAGIYILIGLGYNVIYATSGVFNLAQGELAVIGMFVGLFLLQALGLPFAFALIAVIGLIGALAVVEEYVAVRPVLRHERGGSAGEHNIAWAITTLAVAFILQSTAEVVAGVDPYAFPSVVPDATFELGGAIYRSRTLALFGVALVTGLLLHFFYTRTMTGKALSAISEDDEAASLRGINTRRLKTFAFLLSGGIAGLAAFFIAPITFVFPSLGALYTFKGFIAIAIGGMGNNAGAVIGGVLLALVETAGADVVGAGFRDSISMVFLLVMLLLRPQGITGRYVERAV